MIKIGLSKVLKPKKYTGKKMILAFYVFPKHGQQQLENLENI